MAKTTPRLDRVALWVFGLTLGVRLVYFATTRSPSFHDPLIDGDYYDFLGERIAGGQGFEPGPFWQPPLYPLVLGMLYRLFGHDLLWPRLLQACLDGGTAVLVLLLARRVTKHAGFALGAALVIAFHGPMVFYAGEILPTSLGAFAAVAAIYLAITHGARWPRVAAAGAAVGAGALAVAPVLVLIAPLAAFLWRSRRSQAALALIACFALVGLATIANYVRAGELVPISANAGVNLYIGNHPDSDRLVAIRPGAGWEELANEPARQGIDSAAGQDAYFAKKAASLCAHDPIGCIGRLGWKLEQLLSSREIPRNENLYLVERDAWVLRLLAPRIGSVASPNVIVIPLAIAGIVVALRRKKKSARIVAVSTLCLAAVPVLFFVTGRYRTLFAPELAILAVLGAQALRAEWSRRRPETICAAIALGFAVRPLHLPVDDVPFEAEMYYAIGGRHARLGDDDGAVDSWRKALELRPDYLEAGFNLGLAYERLGQRELAIATYRRLLALHPDSDLTRERLRSLEQTAH